MGSKLGHTERQVHAKTMNARTGFRFRTSTRSLGPQCSNRIPQNPNPADLKRAQRTFVSLILDSLLCLSVSIRRINIIINIATWYKKTFP